MKQFISVIMILIALLVLTPGMASAGSALELVEVRNDEGGPTFIFHVTGEFSKSELESGFVQVDGGGDYPLYCQQTNEANVVCHTTKKTGGNNVVVGFGGARFWAKVPEQRQNSYCYSAWDWWNFTNYQWTDFGPICQDEPASFGDVAYYDYPDQGIYGAYVMFFDYDVSANCSPDPVPYNGSAYYFPGCP